MANLIYHKKSIQKDVEGKIVSRVLQVMSNNHWLPTVRAYIIQILTILKLISQ